MSAVAEIIADTVKLRFSQPWDLNGHALFIQSKRLPEATYEFDREADSYTVSAPARFAHLVGLNPPDVAKADLPLADFLFPVQRWIVEKALQAKRFAVWADCGFGKTPMGLEWARQVSHRCGGRVAILCPKQLIHQWQEEAAKFYPETTQRNGLWHTSGCSYIPHESHKVCPICYASEPLPLLAIESREQFIAWCKGEFKPEFKLAIASHHLFVADPIAEVRHCVGIVLDESSILKGGGGVIKWNLIKSCRGIEYKLSCTATPAPNDTMEYASQASFLEKLRNEGEILWTYFMRDPRTQQWKVRPHARQAFYSFMSSWSIYLRKPSAYGFQDRFDLPEPEIVEHKLTMTDAQAKEYRVHAQGSGELISDGKLGVTARSKLSQLAKGFIYKPDKTARRVQSSKPAVVARLIKDALAEDRQALVWTSFDEESVIIMEHLKGCKGVATLHGDDLESEREMKLEAFRLGEVRCLISKARLLGWGMNFQFCTRMIFSGFDDSFEQFYQAVRRAHRYGAKERLVVHVPFIPELEEHMWNNLLRKRSQWEADIAQQEKNYVEALRV